MPTCCKVPLFGSAANNGTSACSGSIAWMLRTYPPQGTPIGRRTTTQSGIYEGVTSKNSFQPPHVAVVQSFDEYSECRGGLAPTADFFKPHILKGARSASVCAIKSRRALSA